MPIRFQVDVDFYDHPKCIGVSDAAVALWTRAGSYSAAKLLDGFVPESALPLVTRVPEAAAELVTAGLWRKVKGGFQFHQWDERNLLKERFQAKQHLTRNRKQKQRARSSSSENPQVEAGLVTQHVTRDNSVTDSVTGSAVTRDITTQHNTTQVLEASKRQGARGTRLPDAWNPSADDLGWAAEKCPGVNHLRETEKFRNYWQAKAGKDAAKLDWSKTWRNWLLTTAERQPKTHARRPRPPGVPAYLGD